MNKEITSTNKELVRLFYKEVLVDWNMSMVDKAVSPKFRSHDWPKGDPTGPKAFRNFYSAIRSALPDARYEVDDLIAENDRVVVRWKLLGTHKGDFRGISPTGRAVTLNGIAIYRLENEMLMKRWVATGLHKFLEEIGESC